MVVELRRRRAPSTSSMPVMVVVAVCIVIAAAVLVGRVTALSSRVDLTVENPLPVDINVEAGAPGEQGWLALGTVGPGGALTFLEVVDLGRQWVLRFSYAGVDGGEVVVGRPELQEQRWRLTVPAEVRGRLGAAGLVPSEVR